MGRGDGQARAAVATSRELMYGPRSARQLLDARHRSSQVAEVQANIELKRELAAMPHPAIAATDVLLRRVEELGLSREQISEQSGLGASLVRKLLMRSRRARDFNSGKIAKLESMKTLCQTLGIDWAAVQLGTYTVELPSAKRVANSPNGRLLKRRYEDISACLERLRERGAPAAPIDEIQQVIDGRRRIDASNPLWLEPFQTLIAFERQQMGYSE